MSLGSVNVQNVVIIGAGGFGREVSDIVDAVNNAKVKYDLLGYIVESGYGVPGQKENDKPILGGFEWFKGRLDDVVAVCAVGSPDVRMRLTKKASQLGIRFCNIIHPSVILTPWVTLGEGVVITAGCILTNQIRVGNHVHINLGCTIGHDAILGDYVTLAPGVHVSGNDVLEEGCYIGTGTNIIEKIHIGRWSVVGAGSTIIHDVLPNTTVVGSPGKVIKTRESGWQSR